MTHRDSIAFKRLEEISEEELGRIFNRQEGELDPFMEKVRPIVQAVRERGDEALLEFTKEFDGVSLPGGEIRVTWEEREAAARSLDPSVKEALRRASENIRTYHEALIPHPFRWMQVQAGIHAGEKLVPIPSVGLYVPRGKGSFPSVVLMTAIPAMVARVPQVRMVTPPEPNGRLDAAVLVAAELCGVEEIYKVGGAQAIAALALGTQTIQPVSKILGPGSPYVAAAKRLLAHKVDVGIPAGPSEAVVLADASAPPRMAAADLLIEAEHGADSWAFLVTHDENLAQGVMSELPGLLEAMPEWRRDFALTVLSRQGGVILTRTVEEAVDFINQFAPEHLEILTRDPFETLQGIRHAGEVMLGAYTPLSLANYAMGPNAVLPTGGRALTHSPLSPLDFLKRMTVGWATETGFSHLAETVVTLAETEGFPAHVRAIKERGRS